MAEVIKWQTDTLDITFIVNEDGVVCLRDFYVADDAGSRVPDSSYVENCELPLTSIKFAGDGNTADKTAKSLVGSYLSTRLRYESHETSKTSDAYHLNIHSVDENTKASVTVRLTAFAGVPAIRSTTSVKNESQDSNVVLTQVSSLTIGGLTKSSKKWYQDYTIMTANNGWFREAQWREQTLPDVGIDNNGIMELPDGHTGSQAIYSLSNHSSFSTGTHLPMGLLRQVDGMDTWLWQIENNGSWRWEIGDYKDSVYLAAGGPTAADHGWKVSLQPGASFTTVPVACCRAHGNVEAAFRTLTNYRRRIMRPHIDNENLPIIFNDYMNCLMGDPDEKKIQDLLDPVVRMGAEYFVIDAGWYADDSNWWDDVGLWEPSQKRFPSGFGKLLDRIKGSGLIPGLWLEPEVVGVRSVVANRLPEDAFFQENGRRVREKGRFQLDYRHPEVRKWMDKVVGNLVTEYGVGYFKFDYNIEVVQGTDANTTSAGAAHLEHQRAYLSWVRDLLDRHSGLVIENCSSGAQRMEYAMLSVHPLQSTSDQQDPALYAAIAAAVPTAVVPEQSATWAYPQPEWSDEINALTVINSLLGRVHLSGHVDKLNDSQFALVAEGMNVYKGLRQDLRGAHPVWPLGLPRWHDPWVCLGMVTAADDLYVSVWHRGGPTSIDLPLKGFQGAQAVTVELLYPSNFEAKYEWHEQEEMLRVVLPDTVCARLFHVRRQG